MTGLGKLKVEEEEEEEEENESKSVISDALYAQLLMMEEWDDKEPTCFLSVPRKHQGKEIKFAVLITKDERKVLPPKESRAFFIPGETQPSLGFDTTVVNQKTFKKVFINLVKIYKKHLYFTDELQHEILALGAMSTYYREIFFTYPYFDFLAAEYNCGKTTAMQALIWACYQGFCMTDPRPATMFRAIDSCNSSIGIDEIDNTLSRQDVAGEFLSVLNSAYKKGLPAYRVNMTSGGIIEEYDAFGLKAFTHTECGPVLDSFRSRSIIYMMVQSPKKLAKLDDAAVFTKARDLMYCLRLSEQELVSINYQWVEENSPLINRDAERFSPLLTIAKCISTALYEDVLRWAQQYLTDTSEDEIDDNRRIIIEVLLDQSGDVPLSKIMDDFHYTMMDRGIIDQKSDGKPVWKFGTRKFIDMLRSFGIRKSTYHPQNRTHIAVVPARVKIWAERYGLIDPTPDTLTLEQTIEEPEYDVTIKKKAYSLAVPMSEKNLTKKKTTTKKKTSTKSKKKKKKKKKLTDVDNYLLQHHPSRDFSPAGNNMDILMKCFDLDYVFEVKPGFWRITETGEKQWKKLGGK